MKQKTCQVKPRLCSWELCWLRRCVLPWVDWQGWLRMLPQHVFGQQKRCITLSSINPSTTCVILCPNKLVSAGQEWTPLNTYTRCIWTFFPPPRWACTRGAYLDNLTPQAAQTPSINAAWQPGSLGQSKSCAHPPSTCTVGRILHPGYLQPDLECGIQLPAADAPCSFLFLVWHMLALHLGAR